MLTWCSIAVLPNPHWVEELQPQTGLDEAVPTMCWSNRSRVRSWRLERLLALILPFYVQEEVVPDRCIRLYWWSSRSVAIAEKVAEALDKLGHAPAIVHRDIDK